MRKPRTLWTAILALAASLGLATPSEAVTGTVRVTMTKAGLVVGAGGALIGGVGGVQLRNAKGVTITLQGPKGGIEVSANITKVVITLDQSRSTPN